MMRLGEALEIANRVPAAGVQPQRIHLLCGFTPLHLQTFVTAYAMRRLEAVEIAPGLFGDLTGNLERAAAKPAAAIVVFEWSDLDPRLSLRGAGGWSLSILEDIVRECERRLGRMESALDRLCAGAPVSLCGPTLPPPPIDFTPGAQAGSTVLRLRELTAAFETRGAARGVRVVNRQKLEELSPPA
ncbi:MAG: HAD family hydrolase, partial [Acidobacteria bacterium]|nr:HAD family hydrolase [Acidobacteriota bacterium]